MFITIVSGLLVYPTMLWTGVLSIFTLYWLLVAGGALDATEEAPDDHANPAGKPAVPHAQSAQGGRLNTSIVSRLLARIGLGPIPGAVIGTAIALLNFFGCLLALRFTGPVGYRDGVLLLLAVFFVSLPIAVVTLWPLRLCFRERQDQPGIQS